jgi:YegS/Rv2252/BmrU family lipid kinase
VNPAAGGGRARRLWPRIRDALSRRGFSFEAVETRAVGHAITLAAEAARARVPLVVAVGSDGTLNEVVNGLLPLREEHPVTLEVVMTGRGRDAGRNLGLPRDPLRAAHRLADGRVVTRDVGLARWPGGRRFFLGWAGAGFDAVVAERAGGRGGRLVYLRAVLTSLYDYRPAELSLHLDDAEAWTGAAASAVICNGASFGGGMRIAPAARPDDGLLDVVLLGALGRAELARWLPTVYWGGHLANPKIRTWRATQVRVVGPTPIPVQLDGELGFHTPLDVSILPSPRRGSGRSRSRSRWRRSAPPAPRRRGDRGGPSECARRAGGRSAAGSPRAGAPRRERPRSPGCAGRARRRARG